MASKGQIPRKNRVFSTVSETEKSMQILRKPCKKALDYGQIGGQVFLDFLLPPACRLCNLPVGNAQDFCQSCEKNLTLSEPMMRAACTRCGRPRPTSPPTSAKTNVATEQSEHKESCVQCRKEKLLFATAIALWTYQDRVRDAVVAAKYGHQSPLGTALGRRLGRKVITQMETNDSIFPPVDIVTSVPSHWRRQSQRGGNGNQAVTAGLISEMKRKLNSVRCLNLLKITRAIKKQAWLDNQGRRENVSGAFRLKKSYALMKSINQQHILVVDDVLTTGATANEVSRVLLDAGAKRVTLAVIARAIQS